MPDQTGISEKTSPAAFSHEADAALMRRVQAGDGRAFSVLLDRHGARFLSTALRHCGTKEMAEDALQDAFLKVWRRADSFDAAKAQFTTWFHRILVNSCLDAGRSLQRRRRIEVPSAELDGTFGAAARAKSAQAPDPRTQDPTESAATEPDQLTRLEGQQTTAHVAAALAGVSDAQRTALVLTYYEGLKNADAAEVMGIGVKAFESLLLRARRSAAQHYQLISGAGSGANTPQTSEASAEGEQAVAHRAQARSSY